MGEDQEVTVGPSATEASDAAERYRTLRARVRKKDTTMQREDLGKAMIASIIQARVHLGIDNICTRCVETWMENWIGDEDEDEELAALEEEILESDLMEEEEIEEEEEETEADAEAAQIQEEIEAHVQAQDEESTPQKEEEVTDDAPAQEKEETPAPTSSQGESTTQPPQDGAASSREKELEAQVAALKQELEASSQKVQSTSQELEKLKKSKSEDLIQARLVRRRSTAEEDPAQETLAKSQKQLEHVQGQLKAAQHSLKQNTMELTQYQRSSMEADKIARETLKFLDDLQGAKVLTGPKNAALADAQNALLMRVQNFILNADARR